MPDLTKLRYESVKKEDTHPPLDVGDYADIDRNAWKALLIVFLSTLGAVTFSFVVKSYFFSRALLGLTDLQYVILAAVLAAFFASFFFLQAMFTKGIARLNGMVLINALGLVGPFYDRFSLNVSVAAFVIYLLLLFAAYSGWRELSLLMRVKFMRLARRVLPGVMTALALFVSLVFYLNISEGRTNILTRDLLNSLIFMPAESITANFVPEFSFSKSAHQIFVDLATNQVNSAKEAKQLSPSVKKILIDKAVVEYENKIASMIQYPINMNSRVDDVLYGYLVTHVTGNAPGPRNVVGLSAALIAFVTLKVVGIFLAIGVTIISFLLFEMFIATNFATVALESRTREIIVLK